MQTVADKLSRTMDKTKNNYKTIFTSWLNIKCANYTDATVMMRANWTISFKIGGILNFTTGKSAVTNAFAGTSQGYRELSRVR